MIHNGKGKTARGGRPATADRGGRGRGRGRGDRGGHVETDERP